MAIRPLNRVVVNGPRLFFNGSYQGPNDEKLEICKYFILGSSPTRPISNWAYDTEHADRVQIGACTRCTTLVRAPTDVVNIRSQCEKRYIRTFVDAIDSLFI